MKRFQIGRLGIFGLCATAAIIFSLFGCGSPAASEQDAFRGVKWGSEVGTLSGFTQIAQDGDLAFYEKSGDTSQMGEIKLDRTVYGFHKGRFYTAMIYFPAADFNRMKEVLSKQLGEPAQPDKSPSKLIWDGSNVSVLLTSGSSPEAARLAYLFKPIQLEIELKK
ncbi:MAG: hypothetical protein LLG06_06445 [Desulfobacteraceae bacterium]|nr:hypothetical protein [Desulfobacteraceae bacterium]